MTTKPSDFIVGAEHIEEQKEKETQLVVDQQFKTAGHPEWASDYKEKKAKKQQA